MTDRHAGYLVVLAEDVREDDAEPVLNALRMVRGVAAVTPVEASHELQIAQLRTRRGLAAKLHAAIEDALDRP